MNELEFSSPIKEIFYFIRDLLLEDSYIREDIKNIYNYLPKEVNVSCIHLDISHKKVAESMMKKYLEFAINANIYTCVPSLDYIYDLANRIKFLLILHPPEIARYTTINFNVNNIGRFIQKSDSRCIVPMFSTLLLSQDY
ncbi:hypothetical protein GUI12_03495 [Anaplasmataceae bacterium AB001_6]|nr:hypothetical protein GUI12_03495 [Anaplasmataceae bacterium AB001_6]